MKKLLPVAGVALALTLTLAGCSNSEPAGDATASSKPTKSSSASAVPKVTKTPAPNATPSATSTAKAGPVEVTFTSLGEKKADGEYDKFPVKMNVEVTGVDKLKDDELKSIEKASDAQQKNTFAAFDFYKINIQEKYISGKDPKSQASNTSYYPIDEEGTKLNNLPVIGFDWCSPGSFSEDFVKGTPNKVCIVGAVAKGSPAPVGVEFAQQDTPYNSYDGTPAKIFKK